MDAQTQTETGRLLEVSSAAAAAAAAAAAVLDHCSSSKYESTISDIGVEYMRANGGLGRFRQLQRPDAAAAAAAASLTQSSELVASCRTLSCVPNLEDSRAAVLVAACSAAADSQQPSLPLLPGLPPPLPPSLLSKAASESAAGGATAAVVVTGDGHELQEHHYVGYRLGRRKMLGERRKKIADYCLAFAMFGLVLMIAETELCNVAHLYRKEDAFSYVLKSLIGASTVILLVFIGIYHAVDLQLYLIDNCIEDWRIAMTWPRIVQIAAELTACAVHPIPGAYYFKWATYDRSSSTWRVADVPVDIVFSLPMFTRLYLIVRTLMQHSKLFTDASSRSIGALNKISFNTRFVLKTLMTMCPGTVLVVFLVTLWLVAGWTLRCCEHHHDIVFANYLNALYMVAITFLSVGYGDIVPLTYCGRGIAVCSGLMGAGCTALVVAVVANKLQLTRAEKHVHNFMLDTQLMKKLKDAAANVLRETWLIYKHTRLVKRINARRVRRHQQKFLAAIQELRKVKVLQRKLNDEASSMVDLAKTQAQVHELVTEMKQQHIQMDNHVARIENALRNLQLQVESIPSAVGQVLMEKQTSSSFISALEVNTAFYDSPGYRGPNNQLHRQSSVDSSNC